MAAPFTQLTPTGVAGQRYASFAGKVAAAPAPAAPVVAAPTPVFGGYAVQRVHQYIFAWVTFQIPMWRMIPGFVWRPINSQAIMRLAQYKSINNWSQIRIREEVLFRFYPSMEISPRIRVNAKVIAIESNHLASLIRAADELLAIH